MSQEKKRIVKGATKSDASAAVRARVVGAGLRFGPLADAAGIAQSTLSQYIAGGRCNYQTQIAIYNAFCALAGIDPTRSGEEEFWGELLNRAA